jgi:hypothetical protein
MCSDAEETMSRDNDGGRVESPQPEQVVAAATTRTGPDQENAQNLRTTDGLRAGQESPGTPVCREDPALAEEQWFAHADESCPPHEVLVSEARAIQEALTRLGLDASPADVQRDLERVGVRVSRERIRQVQESSHPPRAVPAPAGQLVLTEAERVPPPQGPAPAGPAAAPSAADPADLVRTEAERVPPPDRPRP